jgi:hypothetical protein
VSGNDTTLTLEECRGWIFDMRRIPSNRVPGRSQRRTLVFHRPDWFVLLLAKLVQPNPRRPTQNLPERKTSLTRLRSPVGKESQDQR